MKYIVHSFIAISTVITLGCNKNPIEMRNVEVNVDAKHETEQTDATTQIIIARIDANNYWIQVQLDADKKLADSKAAVITTKVKSDE